MNSVIKFNALHGTVVQRAALNSVLEQAKKDEQFHIVDRINRVLKFHPKETIFDWENSSRAEEILPASLMSCIDCEQNQDEASGLNRAVLPNDVYQMITDKMIQLIKEANSKDYQKTWDAKYYGKGYMIPFNFESKKRYRGVNVFLLSNGFGLMENPFYLTFKQIQKFKGTLKKGAKGQPVVYFTKLYKVVDHSKDIDFGTYDKNKAIDFATQNGIDIQKISSLPILKYYNVFNGADIEGINFDLENFKIGYVNVEMPSAEENRLPIAEAIIKNYPKPQPTLKHGGNEAYYSPGMDKVQMPYLSDFNTVQDYYRTLMHEYSHSTGNHKRLNRDFTGKFGSKNYAFEELIAEWGAVFLSAEAGIIWYSNKNHAGYIKGWNSVLTHLKDDNKFIMRACTKAQELCDYILQPDDNGNPYYLKNTDLSKLVKIEKEPKKVISRKKATSVIKPKKESPEAFANKPKSTSISTAINDVLTLKKYKGAVSPLVANLLYKLFKVDPNNFIDLSSKYEISVLKNDSLFHTSVYGNELFLTSLGTDFITAVNGRLESLKNQKNNYALFDGLKGLNDEKNPAWFPKYLQFKNKPKEAIKHLIKEKKGDCISALYREDIGYIDIPYGENDKNNKGFGLKHIIEKHGKEITQLGFKVEDFIPIIVQYGNFKQSNDADKIQLIGNMFKIIISKKAYLDGKKENKIFVLSAFDLRPLWKKEKLRGLNGTYDGINFTKKPLLSKTLNFIDKDKKIISNKSNQSKKGLEGFNIIGNTVGNIIANQLLAKPATNSLAARLEKNKTAAREYYTISDKEISNFLGKVEKKSKESVAITLTGGQGSMKTRMCFRLMNALGQNYKVGHASIEEHPESQLYENKIHDYIKGKALHNISAPEINSIDDVHKLVAENDVIVIDSFSKLQDMQKGCELDKDFRKAYDGKLFIIIYQQTTDGKMRGGSKSQFDGDIIAFVQKEADYKNNYVYFDKNRYQNKNLEELKYNIFSGKLVQPIKETSKESLKAPVVNSSKFNFTIIEK